MGMGKIRKFENQRTSFLWRFITTAILYLCAMKILMVCLGNICRSPLAEGILQQQALQAGLPWSIESAGTNGFHTGEPPHRLSQKVALLNKIDISHQRSRPFKAADFQRFDLIYAMAGDVISDMKRIAGSSYDPARVDLLMNALHPGRNLDVPDPWYGGEEGYHEVFHMISLACERIILNHTANITPIKP
jgi:protein-tyrosine phosphatase